MKKLGLFLLTLALIPYSFAAPIYQEEGSRIDLGGSLRFQIHHKQGERTDLDDNGSRIRLRINHKISENLTALGNVEMRFTDKKRGIHSTLAIFTPVFNINHWALSLLVNKLLMVIYSGRQITAIT
ncbi:hypothetical protein BKK49_11075 [Rodentibacter rarus]|nr:hypothetical protein BKK49_11075 [Rodentibacter rarus]